MTDKLLIEHRSASWRTRLLLPTGRHEMMFIYKGGGWGASTKGVEELYADGSGGEMAAGVQEWK